MKTDPVLVTGATGYVGGRLIPALLAAGYRVRAMGRSLGKIGCRPRAAENMVAAATAAGLERIIYLGGLAEVTHGDLSKPE